MDVFQRHEAERTRESERRAFLIEEAVGIWTALRASVNGLVESYNRDTEAGKSSPANVIPENHDQSIVIKCVRGRGRDNFSVITIAVTISFRHTQLDISAVTEKWVGSLPRMEKFTKRIYVLDGDPATRETWLVLQGQTERLTTIKVAEDILFPALVGSEIMQP